MLGSASPSPAAPSASRGLPRNDSTHAQFSGNAGRRARPRPAAARAPLPWRIVSSALAGAVAGAAVAFGGTEPASWAAVEIVLFAALAYALWRKPRDISRVAWLGPALLGAYLACDSVITRPAAYLARAQLLTVAACLCGFSLSGLAARFADLRRALWSALMALGLGEALYGVVQYATDSQQVLAYRKIVYTAQATGTYINPNNYAGVLEMLLPLVFARALWEVEQWSAHRHGAGRPISLWLREDNAPRFIFFLFGTLLLSAALLFSRSRTGIAAAWAGLLLVAAVWTLRTRVFRAATAIVVLLAALTFAAGAWIGLAPLLTKYRTAEQDLPSRVEVWKDSAALIRAHPFWGTGPGSFTDAYTRVQTSHLAARLNHAHNDYLEFAAEWGVPGAALLFALIGFVLVRALLALWRAAREVDWFLLLGCCGGMFALLLHAAVDFNLHIPANALLFFVLAGLALALSAGNENAPERRVDAL